MFSHSKSFCVGFRHMYSIRYRRLISSVAVPFLSGATRGIVRVIHEVRLELSLIIIELC